MERKKFFGAISGFVLTGSIFLISPPVFGYDITGKWYGREDDNIGIGYAYLNGHVDSDFDYIQVTEVYWRVVLNDYLAVTADLQYMKEKFSTDEDDIDGFIGGVRFTAEF